MKKFGDKQQLRIAIDTVKNPALGYFLGGMTASEARKLLKNKYKYSDSKIKRLAK
jgi:hypothetical protein|tara:strand:- start:24 stop:188 length:165 start_codon:yes stop_codon:yes gene_type:complete